MNQKLWTALLLPFAFSLAVLPAEAESIPIHRKSAISVKAPAARKAVPRKKAAAPAPKRDESKASGLGPDVEVGLLTSGEVTITGLADFKAESAGKVVGKYGNGTRLSISRSGNTILLNGKKAGDKVYLTTGNSAPAFAVKGNRYRGQMKLIPSAWGSGVTVVNAVPMELYLQSVVPAEAVPSWKADALKAQAVAARTYAMYHKNGYRSSGYDVTDDTRSQVYSGISSETEATSRAVRETAGEIVTYGGKPIDALFHSSGGGYTENSENVWGSVIPYLRGVKESYVGNPWTKTIPLSSFARTMSN